MPGDFGLDPMCLGSDPNALAWYRQAELQHARWAMIGVAGSVVGEIYTGKNFYTAPLEVDLPMNPAALLAFQFVMMHWVEVRRWMDIRTPGSANQDPIFKEQKLSTVDPGYPGGPFDPFGFGKGDGLEAAKGRELYFGRLAMWVFMAEVITYQATGLGPVEALSKHLANPASQTIFSNLGQCVLNDTVDFNGVAISTPCLWCVFVARMRCAALRCAALRCAALRCAATAELTSLALWMPHATVC